MEKESIQNKIIVILGPTSSGKSDIAIKLAKKFDGEIISADSRQVYREMDIGTGKVEGRFVGSRTSNWKSNSQNIRHHMINIISPRTAFNVAKFKKQSEKIIANILHRGKLPIICGGTGFWIQAIVDDIDFPEVKPNWQLRKKLEEYSTKRLFVMLKKLDSQRAKNIDAKNKVRIIRAIEIAEVLGSVPEINNSKFVIRNSDKKYPSYQLLITNYNILQIGLKLSKDKLHKNIEKRVMSRFKQGMTKEVAKLHRQGLSWKKIQSFGLAYFWIPLYLQKKMTKNELVEKVIQAEKNYAKRQMTWFKRDKRISWIKNYKDAERRFKKFLE